MTKRIQLLSLTMAMILTALLFVSCRRQAPTEDETDEFWEVMSLGKEPLYLREEESPDGKYTLVYEKIDDETCSIRGCGGELPEDFHIPTEIGTGIRVTKIQANAFFNLEPMSLKEVWVPDSIEVIEWGVFISHDLRAIHFGSGIRSIHRMMCGGNPVVTLSPDNPYLEMVEDGYIVERATGTLLWAVNAENIPAGIPYIGEFSCMGSTADIITVPDGVLTVGDYAFLECLSVEKLCLPDSVTSIGEGAFWNSNFEAVTGGRYILVPKEAFKYAQLQYISLPDTVTYIESFAFSTCDELKAVYIPASVTEIGENAFVGLKNCTIYCEAPSKPDGWAENWLWEDECENVTVIFGGIQPENT